MVVFLSSLIIHVAIVAGTLRLLLLVTGLERLALIAVAGGVVFGLAFLRDRLGLRGSTSAYVGGAAAASIVGSGLLLWLLWALSHPITTPPVGEYLAGVMRDSGGVAIVTLPMALVIGVYAGSKVGDRIGTGTRSAY